MQDGQHTHCIGNTHIVPLQVEEVCRTGNTHIVVSYSRRTFLQTGVCVCMCVCVRVCVCSESVLWFSGMCSGINVNTIIVL